MTSAAAHMPTGYAHIHFHEIDSTNSEAHRLAVSGELGPLWISADRQLEGRGRHGRGWVSEPGNLYASLLFTSAVAPERAAELSLAAPLAVHAMIGKLLPDHKHLELKWPNDVLLQGRKVAGILIESLAGGSGMIFVVGCGVNLNLAPTAARYGATALAQHGIHLAQQKAVTLLALHMDEMLRLWNNGKGFEIIRSRWLVHGRGIGKTIRIVIGAETVEGIFVGLSHNGALQLRLSSGKLEEIHAGEVEYLDLSEAPYE